jgi:hypothetical protein
VREFASLTVNVFTAYCSRARALWCCANRAAWLASIEIASKGVQRLDFELVKTVRSATITTSMSATVALRLLLLLQLLAQQLAHQLTARFGALTLS